MTNRPSLPRHAFTLIELLVVISIIALLIGILLPVLGSARETARNVQCMSNMRQWGVAVQVYLNDTDYRLPDEGYGSDANGQTDESYWYNALPPMIDYEAYGDVFDGTISSDNAKYDNTNIWFCPSRLSREGRGSNFDNEAFHYAWNNVLDGSNFYRRANGARHDVATHTPTQFVFLRVDTIPNTSTAAFMLEAFRTDFQRATLFDVDYDRHHTGDTSSGEEDSGTVNTAFLDGHVSNANAGKIKTEAVDGSNTVIGSGVHSNPVYRSPVAGIVWGPF